MSSCLLVVERVRVVLIRPLLPWIYGRKMVGSHIISSRGNGQRLFSNEHRPALSKRADNDACVLQRTRYAHGSSILKHHMGNRPQQVSMVSFATLRGIALGGHRPHEPTPCSHAHHSPVRTRTQEMIADPELCRFSSDLLTLSTVSPCLPHPETPEKPLNLKTQGSRRVESLRNRLSFYGVR